MEGGGSDDVEGIGLGIEHGKAVVVLGGNNDVFLASGFGERDDVMRIEASGVEFRRKSFIVGYRDGGAVHDPLADTGDLFAVPGSCGDRVEPPVDEHAETGRPPPLHTCIALGWCFCVLNGGDGMMVRRIDVISFELGERGGCDQKAGESGGKGATVQVHGASLGWNDDGRIVCEKAVV